jgi:shikimate dehydrogenase
VTIAGTTRVVALLGKPVAESLSPRMHNAAFAARALDCAYIALEVEPERLAEAVRGVAALGFAGANVTIPHKQAVLEHCDDLDAFAERAGSVNTLVIDDGRVLGSSTDTEALREVQASRAAVIGAGGAARAFVQALADAGAETRVFSRRGDWPPDASGCDLVVNATPVRDDPLVELRPELQVVDLAYRMDGRPTALVEAGRAACCRLVVDGVEALVRQGAASFERWTGVSAPLEVMRAAVRV